MLRIRLLSGVSLFALVGACQQAVTPAPLKAIERAGAMSFLCLDNNSKGHDIRECPDRDAVDDDVRVVDMFSLVTQPSRGEVALVHLSGKNGSDGVVDVDPTTPATNLIPVGGNPVDIVSTPGGLASFVSSAEGPTRYGIYGLPTSCLLPRISNGESVAKKDLRSPHDLATWPACSLPSAPGAMQLIYDAPDADGNLRATCGGQRVSPSQLFEDNDKTGSSSCPANLAEETQSSDRSSPAHNAAAPGRQKLLVALPDRGEVIVLDAQQLLNRPQGTFDPCTIEATIKLSVPLPNPPVSERLPVELAGAKSPSSALPLAGERPRPSDLAVQGGVLYVSDLNVPLVHRISIADVCRPAEIEPLLTASYEQPQRRVTTRALAVSPLTSKGQRFAYAVDDAAGSIMVFDVSPGSSEHTPLVHRGAAYVPQEPPDRIAFPSTVRDVTFFSRDLPEKDPTTGVIPMGVVCDPNPAADPNSVGALYRPVTNFATGAKSVKLRGLFGVAALTSGQLAFIDEEDLDAPCRRPLLSRPESTENFQGCYNDSLPGGQYYTLDMKMTGTPTVTGEASCRAVDPHRPRSAEPVITGPDWGVHAPSLKTYPRFRGPKGAQLSTGVDAEGAKNPKLLAVDFRDGAAAQVYIGSTLKSKDLSNVDDHLEVDPGKADRNSIAFVVHQPRAFPLTDSVSIVFEGAIVSPRPAGYFNWSELTLDDPDGAYCSRGIEDRTLARSAGASIGVEEATADAFAETHADYVQITAELPPSNDAYWSDLASPGYSCDRLYPDGEGYSTCESMFGTALEPQQLRDFRIERASESHLQLSRRVSDQRDPNIFAKQVDCCFGKGRPLAYTVRAGNQWAVTSSGLGFRHRITVGSDGTCVRDSDPRRRLESGRAYEISSVPSCPPEGCKACTRALGSGPIPQDSPCVFENTQLRFAVYGGTVPTTERDRAFSFDYSGGFMPLLADMALNSLQVSPQRVTFVPELQELFVADGSGQGLVGVSIDTLKPRAPIY